MKKRFFFIASLMLCLTLGSTASYAKESISENAQVIEGENIADNAGDSKQLQQEQATEEKINTQIQDEQIKNAVIKGTVEIENLDDVNGTFSAVLSNVQNEDKIKEVLMAVWCDTNGQDDLKWISAVKNEKGYYIITDDVSAHKYQLGKYHVSVYAVDTEGKLTGITGTSFELNKSEIAATVEQNKKDKLKYDIDVSNVNIPGDIKNVWIPVWSDANGQDDLKWYTAKRNNNGHYTLTVDIRDHKGLGKYNVHIYGENKAGDMIQLGTTMFSIDTPKIATAEIVNKDLEKGTFTVRLADIDNAENIQNIKVPVWSEINEQDDLIWYTAKKKENTNEYTVNVDIKNHNYSMGKYNIGVYITDVTNAQYGAKSVSTDFNIKKGNIEINEKGDFSYQIIVKDFEVPGGIKKVMVPVWSEVNGQDDLVWYTAKKNGDGQYEVNLDVSKHKGLGKYCVNAYAVQPNGNMAGLTSSDFVVEEPELDRPEVECDKKSGQIKVKIPVKRNGELIKKVQVPIWSDSNQDNIVWYTAKKDSEGNYIVETNINKHKYHSGVYKINVYVTDITGMRKGSAGISCDMSPEYGELSAVDRDGSESVYQINLKNLNVPGGEKEVLFAVWGNERGQNDLKWYTAEKVGQYDYRLNVSIRNHRELGVYNVNAYYKTQSNDLQWIANTTFNVSQKVKYAGLRVSNIDGHKGTFKVTISGVMAPSGIEKIQIPTWCSDNQSDIVWYTAIKEAEGIYSATMDVKKHSYHFGNYKMSVYATMGNGIFTGVCAGSQTINPDNYLYSKYVSASQREVWLLGANAEQVQFPTWSETNGQDDIVWYSGVNRGNGTWSVTIDSNNHKHGGKYNTHAYVTKNGVRSAVGSTSYSLERIQTAQQFMNAKANMYSSRTPYLLLVNRSTHKVGIYQGWQGNWRCIQYWDCSDGAPSTPTVEGTFQVGSKGYYFDSGSARCYWYTQFRGNYLFHSVLYNKNGTLMDGRLGMPLSHGCVRLNINNAKWIYDTIPAGSTVVVYH